MVESLFQASMWLVRVTEEFENAVVVLRSTKSVKFQEFVQPGDQLIVSSEFKSKKDSLTNLKVSGTVNGKPAVSGRMTIDSYNLSDRGLGAAQTDDYMRHEFRLTYKLLCNQLEENKLPGSV